ncbi:class I adenylate-forming enzyme family protein [Hyphomonas sp.]|uniref:class I adenylate-forming enzyme family protein n=1 Tax=Hyphomonas sp. TaxID=87 RepID=UPI003002805C
MFNRVSYSLSGTLDNLSDMDGIEFNGSWVKWGALAALASPMNLLIEAAGAPAQAKIGLVARNRPECVAAFLGLLKGGYCVVLINPFQTGQAILDEVAQLGLSLMVAETEVIHSLRLAETANNSAIPLISLGSLEKGEPNFVPGCSIRAKIKTEECALLIGTSGTSGKPKRIPIRYDTLFASVMESDTINQEFGEVPMPGRKQSPLIQYSPLAHITGALTVARAGITGRRLILLEKFDSRKWIRAIYTYKHQIAGLPPAMMKMVLDENPESDKLASLRAVWTGSAPPDHGVVAEFERRYDLLVLGNYGATEYCGAIANDRLCDRIKYGQAKQGAVGRVRRNVADFRIVDPETGREKRGQGILEVRVHRVGSDWIRTSDLASIDGDDFLYIHGRADDAINRGGFKIVPEVITDALKQHEAVDEAYALGLADERLGQVPVALVKLHRGAEASVECLLAHLRSKLVAYQVPTVIKIVPGLPRTPSMKFDRSRMRELFDGDRHIKTTE